MRAKVQFRIQLLFAGILVLFLLLVWRLYQLQVVHGADYREAATQQYVRTSSNIFDRGNVYLTQRDGSRVAAATVMSGYMLALHPSQIEDSLRTYDSLNTVLELDKELFMEHAEKRDDPYEEVAYRLSREVGERIKSLDMPGVAVYRDQWRVYPGASLAAHALGFVGYGPDGHERRGLYGVERYWDSVLQRKDQALYVNFFAELFANVAEVMQTDGDGKSREGDVVTSLEPAVQRALEDALVSTQKEWQSKQLAGIVLDPKTGDVIALAALPSYDLNAYAEQKDLRAFQNPLVEDVYEMGSIIKPLAMAIGLDEGAVRPETTYDDTGSITIDGYTIRNYDGRARGVVSMQEVLNQSLNVGMAYVARRVGGKALGERMRELGFGEETGIDLPFEAHGLVTNLTSPREVEYATAAFGQGIALTPIATARALCALGNGGYLVTPHLVQSIDYERGGVGNVSIDEREQVFTEKTSEEITRMLVQVVDEALRGGTVKKEHYAIAAKTGTAQMAKDGERGYYDDRYLHSFFGYFPAYDPKFLIFLFHTEPQGAEYASETLTNPFMELVDFLISYYEIPPDR
ncbi:MAG: penicillin-binding protein 2 [Candidatus Pacebacteria bacterium]|nr:penicillin-binding protein 2 [Candidatus Paceibacterota bacterium]